MARVPHIVRKRKKSKIMGKPAVITQKAIAAMQVDIRLDDPFPDPPRAWPTWPLSSSRRSPAWLVSDTVARQTRMFPAATGPTRDR